MSQPPIRIAIVGAGKITRDQHIPALRANGDFELVAVANRSPVDVGVPDFRSQDELLAAVEVDAVSSATPPQVRFELARKALEAGKHVMLEKPPATTVSALVELEAIAAAKGLTLFTAWHSQQSPAVSHARAWLEGRRVRRIDIVWREDVRRWHPGQAWVWEPGALGVFDPGINALSILTAIHPGAIWLSAADFDMPSNRAAPIAARLTGETVDGAPLTADFDWRQEGPQTWEIRIETDGGSLHLALGGAEMRVDGAAVELGPEQEYPNLYRRFAELVRSGGREVDARPLQLVADAFLIARHHATEPFVE